MVEWVTKLRAWDGEKMRTDFFLSANGIPCVFVEDKRSVGRKLEVMNWTVMKTIGRKDKKGVDIYEGDVIKKGVVIGNIFEL